MCCKKRCCGILTRSFSGEPFCGFVRIYPYLHRRKYRSLAVKRSLVKYPLVLAFLLLIGYTQAFAPMHGEHFVSSFPGKEHAHIQPGVTKAVELSGVFIEDEEENRRASLKEHLSENTYIDIFYIHPPGYFFQPQIGGVFFDQHPTTSTPSPGSSDFQVLRL